MKTHGHTVPPCFRTGFGVGRSIASAAMVLFVILTTVVTGGVSAAASTGCEGWMMAVNDPSFEDSSAAMSPAWCTEGPGLMGIDRATGWSRTGANNAYIEASDTSWSSILQHLPVPPSPGLCLAVHGFVYTSGNVTGGYFGVRSGRTGTPYAEVRYGPLPDYIELSVPFLTNGSAEMTVFVGYWSPGVYSWTVIDDITITGSSGC
jgi:hypothetical protein